LFEGWVTGAAYTRPDRKGVELYMGVPLPIFLDVGSRRCIVVGGGRVAERKVLSLVDSGADVTVVSPSLTATLAKLVPETVRWTDRPYQCGDLVGAFLAIAATDDPRVNAAVVAEAHAGRVLVGTVDGAPGADFTSGATIRRADLTVAISTSGRSPAFSRWLRAELEQFLSPEYLQALTLAAELRAERRAAGEANVPERWQAALSPTVLDFLRAGQVDEARRAIRRGLVGEGTGAC
jgi:precorrin-2 dehydrogenase/sirohydrochlorin ferrochelatase